MCSTTFTPVHEGNSHVLGQRQRQQQLLLHLKFHKCLTRTNKSTNKERKRERTRERENGQRGAHSFDFAFVLSRLCQRHSKDFIAGQRTGTALLLLPCGQTDSQAEIVPSLHSWVHCLCVCACVYVCGCLIQPLRLFFKHLSHIATCARRKQRA